MLLLANFYFQMTTRVNTITFSGEKYFSTEFQSLESRHCPATRGMVYQINKLAHIMRGKMKTKIIKK